MEAAGGSQEVVIQTDESVKAGFCHRADWVSLSFLI